MQKESLIFGVAGVFFGLLVGWIVGSQQAAPRVAPAQAAAQASAPAQTQAPPALDESRAAALRSSAERNPRDAETRVQLGNLYFDAERFDDAVRWYEEALKIDPKHSKTLLNVGIVRAWGKQDLEGAAKAWERVIEVAPSSEEAARAKQGLDGIRAAHPPSAPK